MRRARMLKDLPEQMSVMAAASFRRFCQRFRAETRQVSANKTPARATVRRFNARIECIANALPKPRGYPVHLHPLRGNIFPHCNPQTRPRKHARAPSPLPSPFPSTPPRDGAVRALYRGEDYAPPSLHLLRTVNVGAASWRDIPNSSSGISQMEPCLMHFLHHRALPRVTRFKTLRSSYSTRGNKVEYL